MKKLFLAVLIFSVSSLVFAGYGFAVDTVKQDTTTMNGWNDWSLTAIIPGQTGIFSGVISLEKEGDLQLGGSVACDGLVFQNNLNGNVLIKTGNVLQLWTAGVATGIDMSAANKDVTINCGLDLVASKAFDVQAGRLLTVGGDITNEGNLLTVTGAGNTTINGILGSGAGGITKSGTGTLTLGGANTYTGATAVNAGTLMANILTQAFGNGSAVTVAAGATLDLNDFDETIGSLAGGGTVTSTGGAAVLTTGGDGTSTTFSGIIQDGGGVMSLIKAGAGALTLSGNNTYNGTTTLNAGTLNINNAGALGDTAASAFVINGGTIDNTSAGTILLTVAKIQTWAGDFTYKGTNTLDMSTGAITLTNNVTITTNAGLLIEGGVVSGNTFNINHVGPGTLSFQKAITTTSGSVTNTSGTLALGGVGNTYTGGINLIAGTLHINSDTALGATASTFTIGNGSTIDNTAFNGAPVTPVTIANANPITINGDFTYAGSVAGNNLNLGTGAVALGAATRTITLNANTLAFGGIIGGGAGAGLSTTNGGGGAGKLTLSGINTYTGATTIGAGTTLALDATGKIENSSGVANSGTFTIAENRTIQALSGAGATTLGAKILTIGDANNRSCTYTGVIGGTGGITKEGTGTLTLTGKNTYTGATTINAGKLLLDHDTSGSHDYFASNGISIASAATFEIDQTSGNARYSNVSKTVTGAGTFSKTGAGETILANDEDADNITTFNQSAGGLINVQAGTLSYFKTAATNLGSLTVASGALAVLDNKQGANSYFDALNGGGNLTYGGGVATARTITLGANGGSGTFSGVISNGGSVAVSLVKTGAGTQTLSGANTYTGATTINAGTLKAGNAAALGTGAGGVTNSGTLDVGGISLAINGAYTQTIGSTLALTVNSASSYGNIAVTGVTTVPTTAKIFVTVDGHVNHNTTFKVVDGAGGLVALPTTIDSSNPSKYVFTGAADGNDLILTVNRTYAGFASDATTPNAKTIGDVIDGIQDPTGDMFTVVSLLEKGTPGQIANSLNSFQPELNYAVQNTSTFTQQQFTQSLMSHLNSAPSSGTGVSTGSNALKGVDVWTQGFGSYLHQAPQGYFNGYNATLWGTILGFEVPLMDYIRTGIAGGFSQNFIRGKDFCNRIESNSYQGTLYGKFERENFYIDTSLTFAYNTYDASRLLYVITEERQATAKYNGQQYDGYIETGYTMYVNKLAVTPLTSFEYMNLHIADYAESGAGALSLNVGEQNNNMAQSGFGVKFSIPFATKYADLVPEFKVKWLYDWVGQDQQATSSFTGGGAAFVTNSFKPDRSNWDFGTKLTICAKNNTELAVNYDFQIKKDFYAHYGYVNVKHRF